MTKRVLPRWAKVVGDLSFVVAGCSFVSAVVGLVTMIVLDITGDLPPGPAVGGWPVSYLLWIQVSIVGVMSPGVTLILLAVFDPDDISGR